LNKSGKNITFGVFGNTSKNEVSVLLKDIIKFLSREKINFLVDESLIKISSGNIRRHSANKSLILAKADCIISLGGDGTFLNTARIVGRRNIPILGINLGRLGFFSEVSPDEFTDFIPKIIQNKFRITEQVIIKSVHRNKTFYALNDIVVDKSDSIRMIETETLFNGEKVVRCISDGMIISTPAGSTGYSLSCNGPVVNPESNVFIITPISPHTFNVRPIIIPDTGVIKIIVPNKGKTRITADGQVSSAINSPSEITLSKADYTIKTIKKLHTTYFNTLKKKLYWNVDKRYR
jgi:NAD+ kinase